MKIAYPVTRGLAWNPYATTKLHVHDAPMLLLIFVNDNSFVTPWRSDVRTGSHSTSFFPPLISARHLPSQCIIKGELPCFAIWSLNSFCLDLSLSFAVFFDFGWADGSDGLHLLAHSLAASHEQECGFLILCGSQLWRDNTPCLSFPTLLIGQASFPLINSPS